MLSDYNKAKKEGDRAYHRAVMSGESPYLPALNAMGQNIEKLPERILGVKEILIDMIVGTKTVGRQNAFANNFMPLVEPDSEFAMKWSRLYDSAVEEGIRDPIKAYEYMNKFYVEEGNKRVSVSRFLGSVTIPAQVIRILPPKTDDPGSKIYYEFIKFYEVTGLFEITFSKEGSYVKLADHFGLNLEKAWPEELVVDLRSAFTTFARHYKSSSAGKRGLGVGDAFLLYLEVFEMDSLLYDPENLISHKIQKLRNEYSAQTNEDSIELVRGPEEMGRGSSVKTLFKLSSAFSVKPIRAAFLFDRSAEESSWAYGHELGANELVEKFEGAVEAIKYEDCSSPLKIEEAFEACNADENDIVFATSPAMMEECLKAAIKYSDMRIMNCSVNLSLNSVPTYYARMYEAKFLMGCLAASIAENHLIGYRADYPIYGGIANINAFALGAAWFDPYARIKLVWASKKGTDWEKELIESGCRIISGIDFIKPKDPSRKYGLYRIHDAGSRRKDGTVREEQEVENLAAPVYQWGAYYEQIIRKLIDGSLDTRKANARGKAVNYWWGMSAGVIDIILSENLPYTSRKALTALRRIIMTDAVNPFEGEIHTQNGILKEAGSPALSDKEIIKMDWLCDNVIGEIPETWELDDSIIKTVKVSGVKNKA